MADFERTPEGARKAIDDLIEEYLGEDGNEPELQAAKEEALRAFDDLLEAEKQLRRLGG